MLRKFLDLPISIKAMIAPVMLTIGLAVVVGWAMLLLSMNGRSLQNISGEIMPRIAALTEGRQALSDMHIAMFRYSSWASNGIQDENLTRLGERISGSLGEYGATLAGLKGEALNETTSQTLDAVIADYEKYKGAVTTFVELAAMDPSLAVMMLTEADDLYKAMDEALAGVAGRLRANGVMTVTRIKADTEHEEMLFAMIAAVGAVLAFGLSLVVARSVARPVKLVTGVMERLAEGDLDVEVPTMNRRDEIGSMVNTVAVFKENAQKIREAEARQEELAREAEEKRRAEMLELADGFETSVKSIVEMIADSSRAMQEMARGMTAKASETKQRTNSTSQAVDKSTSSVGAVAGATEEMSASIAEVSEQVNRTTGVTQQAVSSMETTSTGINSLATSVEEITDILSLIQNIAEQTNLLALNATIEAARAGEAGKGFAVVASEVKQLATQTAKATEQISAQIGDIKHSSQNAVVSISEISGTIRDIQEFMSAIAAAVEEQCTTTTEISRNAEMAASEAQNITVDMSSVSELMGDTERSAEQVLENSGVLTGKADELLESVNAFLRTVRAA